MEECGSAGVIRWLGAELIMIQIKCEFESIILISPPNLVDLATLAIHPT